MYFKQKKKFFCAVIVYILLSFFVTSCSLLEKEEVNFEVEEDTNHSTDKEEQTKIETTKEREEDTNNATSMTESSILYVYICGQVKNPGVYSLESGKRVDDAINLAGGFTSEAAMESLNLARQIVDGEQIYVMSKGEAATSQTTAFWMANSSTVEGEDDSISSGAEGIKVNINTASREELMTLTGIGQAKADSIIAYRQENGPFQNIEEIKQIEGIKDGIFLKIKDQITI